MPIPQPDAIVFDMDGVLVDSEPLHELAFREVFAEMGLPGEAHGMDFPKYYGKSDRALWTDFIALHHPAQPLEELLAWKQSRFLDLLRARQPIFEPIPGLVARLAARFPLAVASGSNHVVISAVLDMRDLRRHFRAVASVQDVARPKPFPDVFLRAAERLATPPQRCLVLEDSAAGVDAALAAGMHTVAITNSLPPDRLSHAHQVIRTYAEFEQLLA